MENWRESLADGDEKEEKVDSKSWDCDVHHIGHNIDQLKHWKPPDSSDQGKTSFEDPDAFFTSLSDHPATLMEKETSTDDVIRVWIEVSKFIVDKLKDGVGVKIAGLGIFTYSQHIAEELDENHKLAPTLRKMPHMILSEFVVRMFDLISPLNEKLCQVPTVPLNVGLISARTKIQRTHVEGCLTEVLQSFARALVNNKNLEFPFPSIGKLQVCNRKVLFKFYANFYSQLDLYAGKSKNEVDPFILPGVMTPLRRHVPTNNFRSVFHLQEVRSVHHQDLLAPVKQIEGEYQPTTDFSTSGKPTYTFVEDGSNLVKFHINQLQGPPLNKRYTISWIRGKRNYLNPCPEHWPQHRYHIAKSSVVLRPVKEAWDGSGMSTSTKNSPNLSNPSSPPPQRALIATLLAPKESS